MTRHEAMAAFVRGGEAGVAPAVEGIVGVRVAAEGEAFHRADGRAAGNSVEVDDGEPVRCAARPHPANNITNNERVNRRIKKPQACLTESDWSVGRVL